MKALIEIRGGNLVNVTTDDPNFKYKVLDYDNEPNGKFSDKEYLEADMVVDDTDLLNW